MLTRAFALVLLASCLALPARATGVGIDAADPAALATWLTGPSADSTLRDQVRPMGRWLRLRIDTTPQACADAAYVARQQAGMKALKARGWKLCLFFHWGAFWKSRTRPAGLLPLDLGEAFQHMQRLRDLYGQWVDAWEVYDEPDIGYVPDNAETYAAFLKTAYAAFAGTQPLPRRATGTTRGRPRVLMAPIAQPPGPWFERFLANDGMAYTDGFNFHYYGYAADLSGVYHQFENALGAEEVAEAERIQESGVRIQNDSSAANLVGRHVPMPPGSSEKAPSGHGALPAEVGTEAGGRKSEVGRIQNSESRIQNDSSAANLVGRHVPMPPGSSEEAVAGRIQNSESRIQNSESGSPAGMGHRITPPTSDVRRPTSGGPSFSVQGLTFTPQDFGVSKPEPWMNLIGAKVGEWQASPALAYLLGSDDAQWEGRKVWEMSLPAPSPVVIDFIAGDGTLPFKRYGGYWLNLKPGSPGAFEGRATVVLYNFSNETVRGTLNLPDEAKAGEGAVVATIQNSESRIQNDSSGTNLVGRHVPMPPSGASSEKAPSGHGALPAEAGTEAGNQRPEARSQKPEVGGRMSDVGGQMSESRDQLSESPNHQISESSDQRRSSEGDERRAWEGTRRRDLPVFISEFGYGALSATAARSVKGRVGQWAWFHEAVPQIKALGISGAMAFYVPPYFESDRFEFGLAMIPPPPPTLPGTATVAAQGPVLKMGPRPSLPPPPPPVLNREAYRDSRVRLTLPPFSRVEIPVLMSFRTSRFETREITCTFEPAGREVALAKWSSQLWPDAREMHAVVLGNLVARADEDGANRRRLLAIPQVREEPSRLPSGPGYASPGVKIEALPDGWRITVESGEPPAGSGLSDLYPWVAEIPWPDAQAFPAGSLVSFTYSCPGEGDRVEPFSFDIRTANGNLYEVQHMVYASGTPTPYVDSRDNFTPAFYGRMELPWRFRDNRPVALVFMLRARHLPCVYEIHGAKIVRFEK